MPPEEEEVFADGFIKVPAKRWYHIADVLTRRDELMDALVKVLGALNEKLAAAEAPPPAPALPPLPPLAPPEWTPLTDRLDIISSNYKIYLSRIKGMPVTEVDRYAGAATTWQTLVAWHVGIVWKKKYGTLREISMVSNNFPNTRFRLRVELGEPLEEKITLLDELEIQAALTLPFKENRLPYDTWVFLDCRSIGPAIVANGSITGIEWN
ncbi:hypothetical protein ES703_00046 [subsurface metagenome]